MRTTCGFGHLYDSDQYASCPYCNRGARAIFFPGSGDAGNAADNSGEDRTVAPSFAASGASFTAPVQPDSIDKTVMRDYMRAQIQQESDNKTIGIFQKKNNGLNPVVGWLVCIDGPDKGQDYRLYNKINSIGRAEENDVVLSKEQTVSQRSHARLAYDPRHNNFQLIPSDAVNIVYVNDAPLYVPHLLSAYDVIEFGDTKLMFIPFCSSQFQWAQEEEK